MGKTVIEVNNISKRYRIGLKEEVDTFAEQIKNTLLYPIKNFKKITSLNTFKAGEDESIFWALQNINFKVDQGEVLGIIGKNGAGKSTLLKILSKITEPTTGTIKLKGRVSALLEVGTGFHPELTGRDNIYMNGTILGMTRKEINQKLDEIIIFSGIEKHIDTPVKFYSSGMKVRLGFSVAAHLEPEILIIDEVLAVGDFEFQKKCLGKMDDVAKSGRTVLFVSHDMAAVRNLCSRVIWLEKGRIRSDNETKKTIDDYLSSGDLLDFENFSPISVSEEGQIFELNKFCFFPSNFPDKRVCTGDNVEFLFEYNFTSKLKLHSLDLAIHIIDSSGRTLFSLTPYLTGIYFERLNPSGTVKCKINRLPISPGRYIIGIWFLVNKTLKYQNDNLMFFEVERGDFYGKGKLPKNGHSVIFNLMQEWSIK